MRRKIEYLAPSLDEKGNVRVTDQDGMEISKEELDTSIWEIFVKDLLKSYKDLLKMIEERRN